MVSVDEMRMTVNGIAIGPDGITTEVRKSLRRDGWTWLDLFFNTLLLEKAIPDKW